LLYKKWLEAWCVVFTVTKHWGGYCSFGASFLKFIFQHKEMKLWNKWSFVQNKTDYLIIHHTFTVQYITLSKYIKWISRSIFLKGFTHANTSLYHNGSLVSRVWTACIQLLQRLLNFKIFKKNLAPLELHRKVEFTCW
jgi:hypothetical protein